MLITLFTLFNLFICIYQSLMLELSCSKHINYLKQMKKPLLQFSGTPAERIAFFVLGNLIIISILIAICIAVYNISIGNFHLDSI